MKNIISILMVLTIQFGLVSDLLAASVVREDGSMFLVWVFLGMCALIVIMQLLPAMSLLFGMLKSLFTSNKEQVKVNAIDKN